MHSLCSADKDRKFELATCERRQTSPFHWSDFRFEDVLLLVSKVFHNESAGLRMKGVFPPSLPSPISPPELYQPFSLRRRSLLLAHHFGFRCSDNNSQSVHVPYRISGWIHLAPQPVAPAAYLEWTRRCEWCDAIRFSLVIQEDSSRRLWLRVLVQARIGAQKVSENDKMFTISAFHKTPCGRLQPVCICERGSGVYFPGAFYSTIS